VVDALYLTTNLITDVPQMMAFDPDPEQWLEAHVTAYGTGPDLAFMISSSTITLISRDHINFSLTRRLY
jgi:hypothetical protein